MAESLCDGSSTRDSRFGVTAEVDAVCHMTRPIDAPRTAAG